MTQRGRISNKYKFYSTVRSDETSTECFYGNKKKDKVYRLEIPSTTFTRLEPVVDDIRAIVKVKGVRVLGICKHNVLPEGTVPVPVPVSVSRESSFEDEENELPVSDTAITAVDLVPIQFF